MIRNDKTYHKKQNQNWTMVGIPMVPKVSSLLTWCGKPQAPRSFWCTQRFRREAHLRIHWYRSNMGKNDSGWKMGSLYQWLIMVSMVFAIEWWLITILGRECSMIVDNIWQQRIATDNQSCVFVRATLSIVYVEFGSFPSSVFLQLESQENTFGMARGTVSPMDIVTSSRPVF